MLVPTQREVALPNQRALYPNNFVQKASEPRAKALEVERSLFGRTSGLTMLKSLVREHLGIRLAWAQRGGSSGLEHSKDKSQSTNSDMQAYHISACT